MRFIFITLAVAINTLGARAEEDDVSPSNDACSQAMLLSPDVPVSSSLMSATYDANVPSCPFPGEGQYLNECHYTLPGCRGVWYQVAGTGDTLQVSTCDENTEFSTQLAVYDSNNECSSSMECIAWNDFEDLVACGETSTVLWESIPGINYTVFLRPAWLDSHEYKDTDMKYTIKLSQVITQANEECSGATQLVSMPLQTLGTLGGTIPKELSKYTKSLHGLWHSFHSEKDGLLEASVCTETYDKRFCASFLPDLPSVCRDCENVMLGGCVMPVIMESYPPQYDCGSYGPVVSIFESDDTSSCNNLTSLEESMPAKCKVTWAAEAGTTYNVLVHGPTRISFNLTITEVEGYPDEVCGDGPDANIGDHANIGDLYDSPQPSAAPVNGSSESSSAGPCSLSVHECLPVSIALLQCFFYMA